jgi:hypothetical protein
MTKPMQGIDGKEFENAIFIGLSSPISNEF